MNITNDILEPDHFYHIYNRGINGCKTFLNEENKKFFLKKFKHYLSDFVDVYAYIVMDNHFHFVIKVKEKSEIELKKLVKNNTFESGLHSENAIISKQFAKFISSYSQSFNKVFDRSGSLFESPFKRKRINDQEYLINLIIYIHLNMGSISEKTESYKYSSYQAMIKTSETNICRNEVLNIFGSLENFIYLHKFPPKTQLPF